jgi:hypothetical protein
MGTPSSRCGASASAAAAELPLGPDLYITAGIADDLVAGILNQPESRLKRSSDGAAGLPE